jgi:2-polyprenyl-6-hydroxyphenyl methylase/3-demethylubiquinone-9 3-methyltransferase
MSPNTRTTTSSTVSEFRNLEAARISGEPVNFSFGNNWQKYLRRLDDEKLAHARESLRTSLRKDDLAGLTFIDAGCGSGIFSLSALQLGATHVTSLDIDPNSIACARYLRERLSEQGPWEIREGSVLSTQFVETIDPADVVYTWGVLHHTGAMWTAIENTMRLVKPGGLMCLALYTEPRAAKLKMSSKRTYNRLPTAIRPVFAALYYGLLVARKSVITKSAPWRWVAAYGRESRGMSLWRDVEDWLGGLPCEFATPEEVEAFVSPRGFLTENVLIRPPGQNNEYLLRRAG